MHLSMWRVKPSCWHTVHDGSALEEFDIEATAPFLSRPNPVHSVEHSDLSHALIDIMADLQGLSLVDPTGTAIPGGLCEEMRGVSNALAGGGSARRTRRERRAGRRRGGA